MQRLSDALDSIMRDSDRYPLGVDLSRTRALALALTLALTRYTLCVDLSPTVARALALALALTRYTLCVDLSGKVSPCARAMTFFTW